MGLPVIAIVGRPNVGKSTLFNRLAGGRRIAIVSDVPGTTRDRVAIDAEWRGTRFMVVDTGGIEDRPGAATAGTYGTPAELWAQVRSQTQVALEQADGVILVVDTKAGLVSADKDAADMVRRAGKPTVVAVNKADTLSRAQAVHEFHAIGLGTPYPVSAYHGEGADALLEALFAKLPPQAEEPERPHVPRVAIVGRPNVGKSALFNALTGEERAIVSPIPGTTRDAIDTRVTYQGRELVLIDTAGLRRRGRITAGLEKFSALRSLQSIERCHVAVIVLDAQEFVTDQDAHVGGFVDEASRAAVVVINKWDLAADAALTQEEALARVKDKFKFLASAPVLLVSALTGRGVNRLPGEVLKVYDEFTRTIPQEDLSRTLADALGRRQPSPTGVKRIRIAGVKQTRTAPPTFTIRTNAPELIHFSYRRYLENRFRESFGFTGSPVRLEFAAGIK